MTHLNIKRIRREEEEFGKGMTKVLQEEQRNTIFTQI